MASVVLEALDANPMVFIDPAALRRMFDEDGDVLFEDLGMDSLALMELSIWLQLEQGVELTVAAIAAARSVKGLSTLLAGGAQPG